MEKEFVTYEQALALKELGFDEPCLMVYNYKKQVILNNKIPYKERTNQPNPYLCTAPLKQQVFRWFREKYGLYPEIFVDDNKTFGFLISSFIEEGRLDKPITRQFNTYDEAELGCVKQLIEIIDRKEEAYN